MKLTHNNFHPYVLNKRNNSLRGFLMDSGMARIRLRVLYLVQVGLL